MIRLVLSSIAAIGKSPGTAGASEASVEVRRGVVRNVAEEPRQLMVADAGDALPEGSADPDRVVMLRPAEDLHRPAARPLLLPVHQLGHLTRLHQEASRAGDQVAASAAEGAVEG
jgi:hypothetical protein